MALHSAFPSERPSRIALAGDWHGDVDHAMRAVNWAWDRGAEGLLHLGDFGIWAGLWGESYLKVLDGHLDRLGMWLGFVDGNHENFDLLESFPVHDDGVRPVTSRITHLPRGFRWTWGEFTWLALGGAVSMDAHRRRPYVDWWPQEAITASQALEAVQGGPVHYMLTHDAPAGVEVPGLLDIWPADAVRAANQHREQLAVVVADVLPYVLFHGHMHVRYSQIVEFAPAMPTKVIGLSDNQGPFGENLLVLDLDAEGFVVLP